MIINNKNKFLTALYELLSVILIKLVMLLKSKKWITDKIQNKPLYCYF
jgi:hypothetical protein